ncbi:MAG: hypothetical protein M9939_16330 [Mesorhizobium sp.]|nr:hypothetical protein [Mesorhizobium sp.]MCO5162703.1 hypothetical protein [Mesorhizobium sp.]
MPRKVGVGSEHGKGGRYRNARLSENLIGEPACVVEGQTATVGVHHEGWRFSGQHA